MGSNITNMRPVYDGGPKLTFRAGSMEIDSAGRPKCRSCGKVGMHSPVKVIDGEYKLGICCQGCGKCFATIAGGALSPTLFAALAAQALEISPFDLEPCQFPQAH